MGECARSVWVGRGRPRSRPVRVHLRVAWPADPRTSGSLADPCAAVTRRTNGCFPASRPALTGVPNRSQMYRDTKVIAGRSHPGCLLLSWRVHGREAVGKSATSEKADLARSQRSGDSRACRSRGPVCQAGVAIQWLWSLNRLWVAVISRHSDCAAARPRRMNRSMCRLYLICPNTGSIVIFRWA